MDIREKLLSVIKTTPIVYLSGRIANAEECIVSHVLKSIADHLIANGVTVQEWIPVTERLPTEEDANEFGEILTVTRNGTITPYYYDRVAYYQKYFPYWMPWSALPQPPKGE